MPVQSCEAGREATSGQGHSLLRHMAHQLMAVVDQDCDVAPIMQLTTKVLVSLVILICF